MVADNVRSDYDGPSTAKSAKNVLSYILDGGILKESMLHFLSR